MAQLWFPGWPGEDSGIVKWSLLEKELGKGRGGDGIWVWWWEVRGWRWETGLKQGYSGRAVEKRTKIRLLTAVTIPGEMRHRHHSTEFY